MQLLRRAFRRKDEDNATVRGIRNVECAQGRKSLLRPNRLVDVHRGAVCGQRVPQAVPTVLRDHRREGLRRGSRRPKICVRLEARDDEWMRPERLVPNRIERMFDDAVESHDVRCLAMRLDDRFSYKELQHLEFIGLAKKGEAGTKVVRGEYAADGRLPVNVSGGSLGCGNVFEATGLHRAAEVALQLRGDAGVRQLDGVRAGVAQSWRFIPSATGAVAVLGVGS